MDWGSVGNAADTIPTMTKTYQSTVTVSRIIFLIIYVTKHA